MDYRKKTTRPTGHTVTDREKTEKRQVRKGIPAPICIGLRKGIPSPIGRRQKKDKSVKAYRHRFALGKRRQVQEDDRVEQEADSSGSKASALEDVFVLSEQIFESKG